MAYNLRNCDGRHAICMEQTQFLLKNITNNIYFNKDTISKYFDTISTSYTYNSCLSNYSNKSSDFIMNFIETISSLVEFPVNKLIMLSANIPDVRLESIIKSQITFDKNYVNKLIDNKSKNQYGIPINMIISCIVSRKIITFKYLITQLDINGFMDILNLKESITPEFELCISNYIKLNKDKFNNNKLINDIINTISNKPKIIKELFLIISNNIDKTVKKSLLDKAIESNTLDNELIIAILEGKDVIPDISTLTKLLSKVYFRTIGATNNKHIAEIIDLFVFYGFKINKDIIKTLINHGCYVNNIEKYGIEIDEEILDVCSNLSYYPYDFKCIPSVKIMLKECEKKSNLDRIKIFKEKGGILDISCLEKACGNQKNGKVIKYLISDCNIKPNEECLKIFQTTYGLEALDIIMKNYTDEKKEVKKNNNIVINKDSCMEIEKRDIIINYKDEYTLKNKIRTMFNYKKKQIVFQDLYELILKYLIDNKLVIGNYFVINEGLSLLLKINQSTIINIDQLENMLSYFVDVI